MFGRKKIKEAKTSQINLEIEMEDLRRENRRLRSLIEDIGAKISSSPVVVDFQLMNVFSIERMAKDNTPVTIIGYFINNANEEKKVKEWYVYCNDQRHQQLVAEFNEYLKNKKA